MSQVRGTLAEFNSAAAHSGRITHKDAFGNDEQNSNAYPVLGNLGYVQRLADLPITVGIGLFVQGGSGNEFNNLDTAFGTQDDLSATFRIARITLGLSSLFGMPPRPGW